jgi:glutathione-independent formaldehyde dehydrogenase
MKAVVYRGPFDVAVEEVPDPRIEQPLDAIIRITTTNICGSDLHPYEGRAPLDAGMVLGHENMGMVEEVGLGVNRITPGDRVSVPFNISCGSCRNCDAGWTSACLRANPSGRPTAGYGYPMMGPYWGGQAEYLRVPWADFNLLKLPAGTEHETDFAMLSDIFPTGYHGTELAQVGPGDTVAIFGAGPVGLMAAHSAALRGASQVFVVDKEPDRLKLAERFGAIAVNFADVDPTEVITDCTDGFGVDCGVEAVGYQAHDPTGQEHPEMVLDELVKVIRATGRLGVVGVYNPRTRVPQPKRPSRAGTRPAQDGCRPLRVHHVSLSLRSGSARPRHGAPDATCRTGTGWLGWVRCAAGAARADRRSR